MAQELCHGGEGAGRVGSRQLVTWPYSGSPGLPLRSLGLQPGLCERGDDPGPPSAPRGGAAGADVRTPAHDPVRLPAQPGPRGPPQGALLRLLMGRPWPLAPPRTHRALSPCPYPPLLLLFVNTTVPHVSCCSRVQPGLPVPGRSPRWAGPRGAPLGAGLCYRWPLSATFRADSCLGLTGDDPPRPRTKHTHYWAEAASTMLPTLPRAYHTLEINTNIRAAHSCRCQAPTHCLLQGHSQASAPDTT